MADIFLSYAHEDRERVRPLVELFEDEGWTVWWDRRIGPGRPWEDELNATLAGVRAVVVVWSKDSVESEWVHHEARKGLERNALVPIRIGGIDPPPAYAHLHVSDLRALLGTRVDSVERQALLRRLGELVPPSNIETVRPGYDPEFLGASSPLGLPGIRGTAAVLRYLHFTVVMNPARRLAHYVAYNIDGETPGQAPRGQDWTEDPLLPASLQLEMGTLRRSRYDRGHLVARTHVMWGDPRQVAIASRQVFLWPNISPQYQPLNRRWWLALERRERALAQAHGRASGFSGPVFTDEDEPFRDEIELEDGVVARESFQIPRGYWKVVFALRGDTLLHAAYHLDQASLMRGAQAPPSRPEEARVCLGTVESLTGLRFSPAHHAADALPG